MESSVQIRRWPRLTLSKVPMPSPSPRVLATNSSPTTRRSRRRRPSTVRGSKPVEADPLSELGATGSKLLQGSDSSSLADLLAETEESECLTPGEVEILNAY